MVFHNICTGHSGSASIFILFMSLFKWNQPFVSKSYYLKIWDKRLAWKLQNKRWDEPDLSKMKNRKCRVQLNQSWFMINNKNLNFHDWILCYCEPFHDNEKNKRKHQLIFVCLTFKSQWSLSNVYMLIFIIYEHLIFLILFL